MSKDENIFTYFEGESISKEIRLERSSSFMQCPLGIDVDARAPYGSVGSNGLIRSNISPSIPDTTYQYGMHGSAPVLHPKHLLTCSVGRAGSKARCATVYRSEKYHGIAVH